MTTEGFYSTLYSLQIPTRTKEMLQSVRIHLFFLDKSIVSYDVCTFLFKQFKSDDFNLIDKQRSGGP